MKAHFTSMSKKSVHIYKTHAELFCVVYGYGSCLYVCSITYSYVRFNGIALLMFWQFEPAAHAHTHSAYVSHISVHTICLQSMLFWTTHTQIARQKYVTHYAYSSLQSFFAPDHTHTHTLLWYSSPIHNGTQFGIFRTSNFLVHRIFCIRSIHSCNMGTFWPCACVSNHNNVFYLKLWLILIKANNLMSPFVNSLTIRIWHISIW